jgi:hypothetical protein
MGDHSSPITNANYNVLASSSATRKHPPRERTQQQDDGAEIDVHLHHASAPSDCYDAAPKLRDWLHIPMDDVQLQHASAPSDYDAPKPRDWLHVRPMPEHQSHLSVEGASSDNLPIKAVASPNTIVDGIKYAAEQSFSSSSGADDGYVNETMRDVELSPASSHSDADEEEAGNKQDEHIHRVILRHRTPPTQHKRHENHTTDISATSTQLQQQVRTTTICNKHLQ